MDCAVTPYRIVIADDHPLVLNGVKTTLSRSDDLEVVGEARDGAEALKLIQQHHPQLLIVDVEMPGIPVDQLAEAARGIVPDLKILVLTAHDEEATIRPLMKVKVSGYLLKDEAPESLLQAVRALRQGAAWFSQTVAHKMIYLNQHKEDDLPLTAREKQILAQIALGRDNQTIAQDLSLAEQTVRNYASAIYEKLGVSSRVEAVVWAREHGFV